MFEEEGKKSLADVKPRTEGPKKPGFNWGSMPVTELVRQMDAIRQHLPPLSIKDISMEEEVLLQLHTLRQLQSELLDDDEIPLNQRVQLANSVSGALKTLGELQNTLFSSERYKKIENLLVQTLNKLPEDVASSFLDDYEALLRKQ